MNFFDLLIDEVLSLTDKLPKKLYPCVSPSWTDTGYSQVILQRDTVCELSGVGFNLVTTGEINDGIILIGDDLGSLKRNNSFARISLVQIEDESDEQKAYNLIRKIEYVKYHHFPDGYMIRTSSRSHKEAVRVAFSAVKKGISFQKVGSLLIEKYKELPAVKAAKVIFITLPEADYSSFEALAVKNNSITEALNKAMNSITFDCDTCNLKAVCDEVEGMKELHFKNASMGKM